MRRRSQQRRFAVAAAAALMAAGIVSATGAAPTVPAAAAAPVPVYLDTHYPPAVRAADLVARMTLTEKVSQLQAFNTSGVNTSAIPRLGVQQYFYATEGQHGALPTRADTNPGSSEPPCPGLQYSQHCLRATSFSTNLASTMSWDPQLVYQETTAISDEARGFLDKSLWGTSDNNLGPSKDNSGYLTYYAPTVNMDRDPRWGRTDEGFGEDPYLVGQMAGAYVDGYQGETMSGRPMTPYLKVAATAKHYAMNNVENTRQSATSDTDDANVRDYYTAPFNSLTRNAHLAGVMTAFNAINGTPAPVNTYTDNELLQRTYGNNGYTVADNDTIGSSFRSHHWAAPGWTINGTTWTNTATGQQIPAAAGTVAYALRAGSYVVSPGGEATVSNIQAAINAGILSEGVLDNALVRMFTIRMQTGEFDPPSQVPYTKITKSVIEDSAHQALARKVADESLVLLKNGNVAGTRQPLLPVNASMMNNVVIVGDLANQVTLGGYSSYPSLQVSALQGITDAVKAANPGATVTYDGCGTSTTATSAASCSAATMAAMKTADLVVVFTGTDQNSAHETLDRASLAMPGNYESLISQVAAVGNPRTALDIQADGPVDISGVQQDFPAIVFSGYNGESQGSALADVLTGKQNPAGHLDFTWYKDASQLPDMNNYGLTPSQTGGLGRTYRYFTGTPTYPFGYGLSYSAFKYSSVEVAPKQIAADGTVNVNFNVTNTGHAAGATVAQLYASPQFTVSGAELPRKELAGFQKTRVLAPGQTQHITLKVSAPALSQWDENALKQVVYNGPYQFQVSSDAATVQGAGTADISGAITPMVQSVTVQPDHVVFAPGDTLDLTGKNPWIADDTNPSLEQPHAEADHIVEAVNNDQSFVDLSHARVSYASSNPSVATVSPAGKVTTIAAGAATISVTVNGVTGTTPLIVQ